MCARSAADVTGPAGLGPEAADLYGLPLEEFIPARDALAKRLRKDDRERAAAVKKLPKPSVAAWAVNQAARSQPKERRALLESAAELARVQEAMLAGEAKAGDLEAAVRAQREATDALVAAASGLLSGKGTSPSGAALDRVRETFQAVATDPELAELVEAGTVDRERRAAGLGFALGGGAAPSAGGARPSPAPDRKRAKPKSEPKPKPPKKEPPKPSVGALRDRAKEARAAEREAAKRVRKAERGAKDALKAVERAERELDRARAEAERARAKLEKVTAAHGEAEQAAARAEAELARAKGR
jgi:hypothetical protein